MSTPWSTPNTLILLLRCPLRSSRSLLVEATPLDVGASKVVRKEMAGSPKLSAFDHVDMVDLGPDVQLPQLIHGIAEVGIALHRGV